MMPTDSSWSPQSCRQRRSQFQASGTNNSSHASNGTAEAANQTFIAYNVYNNNTIPAANPRRGNPFYTFPSCEEDPSTVPASYYGAHMAYAPGIQYHHHHQDKLRFNAITGRTAVSSSVAVGPHNSTTTTPASSGAFQIFSTSTPDAPYGHSPPLGYYQAVDGGVGGMYLTDNKTLEDGGYQRISNKRSASTGERDAPVRRKFKKAHVDQHAEHQDTKVFVDEQRQAELEEEAFCHVPGRLSLLSSNNKYTVTINEIKRRLGNPECLNASLLGGILRRAKSKNGGKLLRDKLDRIGVKLPAGRRKATAVTLMTSLVEGEAQQLACDFDTVCESEFPASHCAQYSMQEFKPVIEMSHRKNMIACAKTISNELAHIIRSDRNCLMATAPDGYRIHHHQLDTETQNQFDNFSLLTHGLGSPIMLTALSVFNSYCDELVKQLSTREANDSNYSTVNNANYPTLTVTSNVDGSKRTTLS